MGDGDQVAAFFIPLGGDGEDFEGGGGAGGVRAEGARPGVGAGDGEIGEKILVFCIVVWADAGAELEGGDGWVAGAGPVQHGRLRGGVVSSAEIQRVWGVAGRVLKMALSSAKIMRNRNNQKLGCASGQAVGKPLTITSLPHLKKQKKTEFE